VITEALPNSSIGNGLLVLSAWLHFALAATISQILACLFSPSVQDVGRRLVQMWHRLSDILWSWYEEILEDVRTPVFYTAMRPDGG